MTRGMDMANLVPAGSTALQLQIAPAVRGGRLPDGWTENVDERTGRIYYFHAAGGFSSWDRPWLGQIYDSHSGDTFYYQQEFATHEETVTDESKAAQGRTYDCVADQQASGSRVVVLSRRAGSFGVSIDYDPCDGSALVVSVEPGTPAADAVTAGDLRVGDAVTAINGSPLAAGMTLVTLVPPGAAIMRLQIAGSSAVPPDVTAQPTPGEQPIPASLHARNGSTEGEMQAQHAQQALGGGATEQPDGLAVDTAHLVWVNGEASKAVVAGDLRRAASLFAEALQMYTRMQGKHHPDTLMVMHSLAKLLLDLGDVDDAVTHFRNCLRLRKRSLGIGHKLTLESMQTLGGALEKMVPPHTTEAIHLYKEATMVCIDKYGAMHPWTVAAASPLTTKIQRLEAKYKVGRDGRSIYDGMLTKADRPQMARLHRSAPDFSNGVSL